MDSHFYLNPSISVLLSQNGVYAYGAPSRLISFSSFRSVRTICGSKPKAMFSEQISRRMIKLSDLSRPEPRTVKAVSALADF